MSSVELYQKRKFPRFSAGCLEMSTEPIVNEISLKVFLNGTEYADLACSPGGFNELAAGYLLSQGLIKSAADIERIFFHPDESAVYVEAVLREGIPLEQNRGTVTFCAQNLLHLMGLLEEGAETFRITGGVHSAALGNAAGLVTVFEDIGRHNAVDKVFGYVLLNHITVEDKCLVLSGRVASEILFKVARTGVPLILSRSAPMQIAVDAADELGITIVGFARGDGFIIYSHPERVYI